jgi:DNA-binding helix-hairpin-helix protein with protein kinase domain
MHLRLESDGREYTLEDSPLAQGGEAAIYAVRGDADLAAKVYHQPTPEQAEKLTAMLAAPPPATRTADGHVVLAWPTGRLVSADGVVVGYLMPRLHRALPLCEIFNPSSRRRRCPLFHYGYLLRAARNLAAAVRSVHDAGYVIGDLNESNVLITNKARVTLVDVDSFQVRSGDRLYRCRVGKPEYTPPELMGAFFAELDRAPDHDVFALAVLVFQLLMQGLHPFAGVYAGGDDPPALAQRIIDGHWPYAWDRIGPTQPAPHAPPWEVLPPLVQELMWRCFDDGHALGTRPSAADWQQALEESEKRLTACSLNEQHVFARGLDVCPWCLLDQRQGHDPFPSQEELQRRRVRAQALRETARSNPAAPAGAPAVIREDPDPRPLVSGEWQVASAESPFSRHSPLGTRHSWSPLFDGSTWLLWIAVASLAALVGVFWTLEFYWPK